MAIINGVDMPNFTHKEIPRSKAQYMSKGVLYNLQSYRDMLGHSFSVSIDPGALVRFTGRKTSEHYVRINLETGRPDKLSRAIDGFPNCDIFEAWSMVLSSNLFNGIGVYFDTKNNQGEPQCMLHLDLRSRPLIWYRNNGVYHYPHKDKSFFNDLMVLLS